MAGPRLKKYINGLGPQGLTSYVPDGVILQTLI